MSIDDQDDVRDDALQREDVERRREVRGLFQGLEIRLQGEEPLTAVEASRRGFFCACDDPDHFTLGDVVEADIVHGGRAARCRLEVTRKEIDPRRGVVLRIAFIDPRNEELLKQILGPIG